MKPSIGTTRIVFCIGRLAFKFAGFRSWKLFLCGLLANMQEAEFSPLSADLCPVRFSIPGGWLVVMARAEPLTGQTFDEAAANALIERTGFPDLIEFKPSSFGRINGRLVAIDYG